MNCLVTGGFGFLGGHVVQELLDRGYSVTILDQDSSKAQNFENCKVLIGDIRDQEFVSSALNGIDYVFHFAAILGTSELFDNPREAVDTNIHGTLNVILGAIENKVSRLFVTTKPNEWHNIYSVTSQAIEKLALSYAEYSDLDIRILKTWNIYGPDQKVFPVRKAIPLFIIQALENKPIEIYGTGDQEVRLIYSVDYAKIAVDFVSEESVENKVYEIFPSYVIRLNELVDIILRLTNSKSKKKYVPMRVGEKEDVYFRKDTDIKEIIGSWHETELLAGIQVTIDFYKRFDNKRRQQIIDRYGK